jgi:hypothetical protein
MNAIPFDLLKVIVEMAIPCGTRHVNILLTCKKWNIALKETAIWKDIQCIKIISGLSMCQHTCFQSVLSIVNDTGTVNELKVIMRYDYDNNKPLWNISYGNHVIRHVHKVKTTTNVTGNKPASQFISNSNIVEFLSSCINADSVIHIKHWPDNMDFTELFVIIGIGENDCQFRIVREQNNGILTVCIKYSDFKKWLESNTELSTFVEKRRKQIMAAATRKKETNSQYYCIIV